MKARIKNTGEIIEVERLTNTTYGRLDVAQIYRKDMLDFDLPEPEEEVTIEGWVARDDDGDIYAYRNKPTREDNFWLDDDAPSLISLPITSFPDLTWESDPLEVTITIKPKKKI